MKKLLKLLMLIFIIMPCSFVFVGCENSSGGDVPPAEEQPGDIPGGEEPEDPAEPEDPEDPEDPEEPSNPGVVPENPPVATVGLEYQLDNETYTVKGLGTASSGNIVIPATYEDKAVTKIAAEAFKEKGITGVILPEGLLEIGQFAFSGNQLRNIHIPSTVTTIGLEAFSYNNYMNSITFEENSSLETIGEKSFRGCLNVASITIPKSVITIEAHAFSRINSLTEIKFEDNSELQSIGEYAFKEGYGLKTITIPKNVETIGEGFLEFCTSLTTINYNCEEVSFSEYYPKTFTNIGTEGTNLTLNIGKDVKKIPARLFYYDSHSNLDLPIITHLVFEDGSLCTSIGEEAFKNITTLKEVSFAGSSSLETIEKNAFVACSALLKVEIPETLKVLGTDAFGGCTVLTLKTENSGKYLGNESNPYLVLMDITDTSITSFTVPESTKIIASYAFAGCSSLKTVVLPENLTNIGYSAININLNSLTFKNYNTWIVYDNATLLDKKAFTSVELEDPEDAAEAFSSYKTYIWIFRQD